jgi:Zn-dependent protease with chaperone function
MAGSPSLAARAALALALLAGFYLLAVGLAAGLLWLPYAEWRFAHRVHAKLAIFAVAGAGIILWSILPRPDRFTPPGPSLAAEAHPRLFAALREVAGAVSQAMPADVYLVPDVNAWVARRGGLMGIGSRRVMGLGLPLLSILTVPQLRAVLAHEFGHYHGGDTALGPWVYRTRAAIGRTIHGLAQHSRTLQAPFLWYGKLFLRLTHAVSRRQELAADALAARLAGARPLAEGLRAIHAAAPAFQPYWATEVAPVLDAGYLPPLGDGFARFVKAVRVKVPPRPADPYDTHPPLEERLAALGEGSAGAGAGADGAAASPAAAAPAAPTALSLLENVPAAEADLLAMAAGDGAVKDLTRVAWDDLPRKVYIPAWEGIVRQETAALLGMTPASIPEKIEEPRPFGQHMAKAAKRTLSPDESRRFAATSIGAALALALLRRGFEVRTQPGAPIALERGELRIEPFTILARLASGALSPAAWRDQCDAAGIAEVDLGTIGA